MSDIVCDQQGTIRPNRYPYGSPIELLLVRRKKSRQDVTWAAGRAAVLERNEGHFVAAERAAVPGAVLAAEVVCYKRESCVTPQGQTNIAPLPAGIAGGFGPGVRPFCLALNTKAR